MNLLFEAPVLIGLGLLAGLGTLALCLRAPKPPSVADEQRRRRLWAAKQSQDAYWREWMKPE